MDNIAALLVTYNPDVDRLKKYIYLIRRQANAVILIDNGSDNSSQIEEAFRREPHIHMLFNRRNEGIARALNQGFRYATGKYEWLLTFDQDSLPSKNFMQIMVGHMEDHQVAILCPRIIDRNLKYTPHGRYYHPAKDVEFVEECITSGSLTRVSAWEKVGGFDETMFIDMVDFEFCYRLRQQGYRILRDNRAKLLHEIGHSEERWLLKPIAVYHHAPWRRYYWARNSVYVCRKHPDYRRWYVGKEIFVMLILILFFEDQKLEKIWQILRGIRDGFRMEVL